MGLATDSESVYQVILYVVLFLGLGALGSLVGYILSFLFHERRKKPEEPEAADRTAQERG